MKYTTFIEETVEFDHLGLSKLQYKTDLEDAANRLDVQPLDIACTVIVENSHEVGIVVENERWIENQSRYKPWHYGCVLHELIHVLDYTPDDLAPIFGVSETTIKTNCKKFGVIGKKRVAWEVVSSWENARQETINRDGACILCGITNSEYAREQGRNLDAHHVIPRKVFDEKRNADSLDNLVTLCKDCHPEGELTPRLLFQKAFGLE